MKQKIKFAVTGALAGSINGLFGAGGGMILVPLFTHWAKMEQRTAFATSVCVILPLSIVSAAVYYLRSDLQLAAAWPYLLGGLIGGFLGGKLFRKVPEHWLRRGLGLLILYGGVRILL